MHEILGLSAANLRISRMKNDDSADARRASIADNLDAQVIQPFLQNSDFLHERSVYVSELCRFIDESRRLLSDSSTSYEQLFSKMKSRYSFLRDNSKLDSEDFKLILYLIYGNPQNDGPNNKVMSKYDLEKALLKERLEIDDGGRITQPTNDKTIFLRNFFLTALAYRDLDSQQQATDLLPSAFSAKKQSEAIIERHVADPDCCRLLNNLLNQDTLERLARSIQDYSIPAAQTQPNEETGKLTVKPTFTSLDFANDLTLSPHIYQASLTPEVVADISRSLESVTEDTRAAELKMLKDQFLPKLATNNDFLQEILPNQGSVINFYQNNEGRLELISELEKSISEKENHGQVVLVKVDNISLAIVNESRSFAMNCMLIPPLYPNKSSQAVYFSDQGFQTKQQELDDNAQRSYDLLLLHYQTLEGLNDIRDSLDRNADNEEQRKTRAFLSSILNSCTIFDSDDRDERQKKIKQLAFFIKDEEVSKISSDTTLQARIQNASQSCADRDDLNKKAKAKALSLVHSDVVANLQNDISKYLKISASMFGGFDSNRYGGLGSDLQRQGVVDSKEDIAVIKNAINAVGNNVCFGGGDNQPNTLLKKIHDNLYIRIICPTKNESFSVLDENGKWCEKQVKAGEIVIDQAVYIIKEGKQTHELKTKAVPLGGCGTQDATPGRKKNLLKQRIQNELALFKEGGTHPESYSNIAESFIDKLQKPIHVFSCDGAGGVRDCKKLYLTEGSMTKPKKLECEASRIFKNRSDDSAIHIIPVETDLEQIKKIQLDGTAIDNPENYVIATLKIPEESKSTFKEVKVLLSLHLVKERYEIIDGVHQPFPSYYNDLIIDDGNQATKLSNESDDSTNKKIRDAIESGVMSFSHQGLKITKSAGVRYLDKSSVPAQSPSEHPHPKPKLVRRLSQSSAVVAGPRFHA